MTVIEKKYLSVATALSRYKTYFSAILRNPSYQVCPVIPRSVPRHRYTYTYMYTVLLYNG